jgi:hypothetical protein
MDVIDFDIDDEDAFSTALGTETLTARDMVPEGFDNIPRARSLPERIIQRRKYLVIDQSVNQRN